MEWKKYILDMVPILFVGVNWAMLVMWALFNVMEKAKNKFVRMMMNVGRASSPLFLRRCGQTQV